MERKYEIMLGTIVLIIGIIVLLFVLMKAFALATSSGDFIREQTPGSSERGPNAFFHWHANGLNVTFSDSSTQGTSPIKSYDWDFGDGYTDNTKQPASHTYNQPSNYTVMLRIEDQNGKSSYTKSEVRIEITGQKDGNSESTGGEGFGDMSQFVMPIAVAIMTFGLYTVMCLVGSAITKAGWNIIKPKPETIQVRVKPKNLVVEPVDVTAKTLQQQQPPQQYPQQQYPQQPPQQYPQQQYPQQQSQLPPTPQQPPPTQQQQPQQIVVQQPRTSSEITNSSPKSPQ